MDDCAPAGAEGAFYGVRVGVAVVGFGGDAAVAGYVNNSSVLERAGGVADCTCFSVELQAAAQLDLNNFVVVLQTFEGVNLGADGDAGRCSC